MAYPTIRLPQGVVRQIRKLRREGFSIRKIEAILGVSHTTVQKYLKGPVVEHTERLIPDEEDEEQFDQ